MRGYDKIQKALYERCEQLVFHFVEKKEDGSMAITTIEAYVIMKALEDQCMYHNPQLIVDIPDEHAGI